MFSRIFFIALAAAVIQSAALYGGGNQFPYTDIYPELRTADFPPENPSDDQWDLQFNYNVTQITGDNQLLGVAFDGEYFWVSSADNNNWLYILDRNGNFIQSIQRPITQYYPRDLCYHGGIVYGGTGGGIVGWRTSDLPSTPGVRFTLPYPAGYPDPRGLAYDPATDHFYCANFSDNLYEMDRNGNLVRNLGPGRNAYGLAWDNDAPGNPKLWVHTQNTGCMLYQIDPVTGQWTRFGLDLTNQICPGAVAGGLDYTIDWDPQRWRSSLLALGQGPASDHIAGFEMYPRLTPINMRLTMLPSNPPLQIPANGGSFDYDMTLEVNMSMPLPYRIWINATLPDGSVTEPLAGPVNPRFYGGIVTRTRTQFVPAGAPAGNYTYHAYLGVYPDTIWSETHFPFEKSAAGEGDIVAEWANTGEDFPNGPENTLAAPPMLSESAHRGGSAPVDSAWQLITHWPVTPPLDIMAVAFDGDNYWIAYRGSGVGPSIVIQDTSGQVVTQFTQHATSAWGIRGLTSDGVCFYGGWEGGLDVYDIASRAYIRTIPHPISMSYPRAAAYDPRTGHFFCGNFTNPMYEIDYDGTLLRNLGIPIEPVYGMTFDLDCSEGPRVWVAGQGTAGAVMRQIDPDLGTFTGSAINLPPLPGQPQSQAGALFYSDDLHAEHTTMIMCQAGLTAFYEMHSHLGAGNCRITLSPSARPTLIPAGGGAFNFDLTLEAFIVVPVIYRGWTTVTLPDGSVIDPLMGPVDLAFYYGSITRSRSQLVPGRAPAGRYIYHVYTGMYPNVIWGEDHFPFEKLPSATDDYIAEWANTGEEFTEAKAPPVVNPVDSTWELIDSYEIAGASHMGIAYDGQYFWAANRIGGPATNHIEVIDPASGSVVAVVPQGATSNWGIRDMCSDGSYIYGGWENGVDKFDIAGMVWTGTIPHPAGLDFPRALTYNPENGHFFCANFSGSMYEMDHNGVLIRILGNPPGIVYGMAFDADAPGGPFIWLCVQELAGALMYQMNAQTGALTGVVMPLPPLPGQVSSEAGLCFYTDEWNNQHSVTLVLNHGTASDSIGVYEMHPLLSPSRSARITMRPANTPVIIPAAGGVINFDLTLRAEFVTPIIYNGWINATLPDGSVTDPLMGPVQLTHYAGSVTRSRAQSVPGRAPAGHYIYHAYIGIYPIDVWSADHFPFDKTITDNGEATVYHWGNTGEALQGNQPSQTIAAPSEFALHNASPNPFNPVTNISFTLPEAGRVSLKVYDVNGKELASLVDGWCSMGKRTVTWDASEFPSGIYFARLQADGFSRTLKLMLIK